jgi:hypothetical protein
MGRSGRVLDAKKDFQRIYATTPKSVTAIDGDLSRNMSILNDRAQRRLFGEPLGATTVEC